MRGRYHTSRLGGLLLFAGMFFSGFPLPLAAQETVGILEMICTVKEDGSGLPGSKIIVYQDGTQFDQKTTDNKGRAVFKLPYLHDYRIEFSKEQYVTKFIEVTTNLPKEEVGISSSFKFDVRLFRFYPELDVSSLKKPVAKLQFDAGFEGGFYYDMKYHKEVKEDLKAVEEHALALGNQELRKIELLYNKAIAEADKSMANKDYANAREEYVKASSYKPDQAYPKQQLAEIDRLFKELNAKKTKYDEAITQANQLFNTEKFEEAKVSYQKASGIMPDEVYPKSRISEIDRILAARGDEAKQDEAYQAAIRKADGAFNAAKYDQAVAAYKEALGVKPGETHPTNRIAEIEKILADQKTALAKEKDEKYKQAVSTGEEQLTSKQYDPAMQSFQEALGYKPGDAFATQKINEIKSLKERAALEAQQQGDKDQSYLNAISKGDKALKEKDYTAARAGFQEAQGIKPGEKYPQVKLDEIDRILKDLEGQAQKDAEKDQEYKAAMTRADLLFSQKNYPEAKNTYQHASNLKPYEILPKEKIKEINDILAGIRFDKENAQAMKELEEIERKKKLEEDYRNTLMLADKAFGAKDYEKSTQLYQKALSLKPSEEYPKTQLSKIKELANQTHEVKDTGKKTEAGKYDHLGEGIHRLEPYKERNNTVDVTVVVKNGNAIEYKKVTTSFGQIWFYKDGVQISQGIFDQETK